MWEIHPQEMWMDSRQGEFNLCRGRGRAQGVEGRASFSFCSLQCLLSVPNHWHSLGVFCSLLFRLQEDTVQRLRMDFWVLPRRRSSATAKPRCMKCCRRKGAGAEWAWINQLCSLWGSKTSEKRQMLTLWMSLKKTGKENGAVQCRVLERWEGSTGVFWGCFVLNYFFLNLFSLCWGPMVWMPICC